MTINVMTLALSPAVKTSLKLLKYGFALKANLMHIKIDTQMSATNQNTMPIRPSNPSIPAATPIKMVVRSLASVNAFKFRVWIKGFVRSKNVSSISSSFSF